MYMCAWCLWKPEEDMPDLLKLELQVVIIHHASARNQTWVFWKNSQIKDCGTTPWLAFFLKENNKGLFIYLVVFLGVWGTAANKVLLIKATLKIDSVPNLYP